jgi:hypothetical protein
MSFNWLVMKILLGENNNFRAMVTSHPTKVIFLLQGRYFLLGGLGTKYIVVVPNKYLGK